MQSLYTHCLISHTSKSSIFMCSTAVLRKTFNIEGAVTVKMQGIMTRKQLMKSASMEEAAHNIWEQYFSHSSLLLWCNP